MKSALAGIAAVAMATAPVVAAEGPGRALIAANTVQISTDPAVSATDNSVTRAFIPPYSGTVRVKWEVKSKDGTAVFTTAQVTHVDESCGVETTSMSYVAQSCDVRVTAGMPIFIAASGGSGNTVSLRKVSLSYKVVNSNGEILLWQVENPI